MSIHKEFIKAVIAGNREDAYKLRQKMVQESIPAPVVVVISQRPDGLYSVTAPPKYPITQKQPLTVQQKNKYLNRIEKHAPGPVVRIYLKEDEKDGMDGAHKH